MENSNISKEEMAKRTEGGRDLVKGRKCSKGKRKVGLVGHC